MAQLCTIAAKAPKDLVRPLKALLTGWCVVLSLVTEAATEVDATTQIETTLDDEIHARLTRHYPDVSADSIQFDYDLPGATDTFAPCSETLRIDWRGQSMAGRQTPKISCPAEGWQLYVPVSLAIHRPVVVAADSLSRGQRLNASDLRLKTLDIGTLRLGYFDSIEALSGYEVARPIQPGDVITPYMAEPPLMIERGDRVVIIATTAGGLSVRTLGEALRDGRSGEQIPVRNQQSRKVVHAYVKSQGVVEIKVE